MTSSTEEQKSSATRTWCCGTAITAPHVAGCAYEPRDDPEPPSAPNPPSGPAPAAASSAARTYGFRKADEEDVELPSGGLVRIRKLNMNHVFSLRITEMRDAFTSDLLSDGGNDADAVDENAAQETLLEALLDPDRSAKFLEPINRVVAAAVLCPTVVTEGPSNDEQMNVGDIDVVDKFVIFTAAVGEQLAAFGGQQEALKSVQPGPAAGVPDLPAGNSVQPEAE